MITINGVEVPIPNEFTAAQMDIVDAERNSKGTMFIEEIAQKWKLTIKWNYLNQQEMSKILGAMKPIKFKVTFPDPETGNDTTAEFYKGDRVIPMEGYRNGKKTWKDFSINFIEV